MTEIVINPSSQHEYIELFSKLKGQKNIELVIRSIVPLDIIVSRNLKSLDLSNCNVKSIRDTVPVPLTTLKLPINGGFSMNKTHFTMFGNVRHLDCGGCDVGRVPAGSTITKLSGSNIRSIGNQQNLVELKLSGSPISELPFMKNLDLLVCDSTNITKLPNFNSLTFLLCFDTDIKIIPKSICKTIKYCFMKNKLLFESVPNCLIEAFDMELNQHYLSNYHSAQLTQDEFQIPFPIDIVKKFCIKK